MTSSEVQNRDYICRHQKTFKKFQIQRNRKRRTKKQKILVGGVFLRLDAAFEIMNWSAVTSNIVIIAPVHHSKLPYTERGHANNIGRRLICSAELIGVYIELLHNKIQEADIAEIVANCLTNYTDKPEAKVMVLCASLRLQTGRTKLLVESNSI